MKKKLCIVASAPSGIVAFWKTNIEKLSSQFDIYVVANYRDSSLFDGLEIKGCISINIERRPSVMSSLKAVNELRRYFKKEQFDGFISMSSNASLVAAIAGWLVGVPFRARIFTGQVWANKTGMSRTFFKTIDKLTVALNNHILVDGKPQQKYLVENGILKEGQSTVLANGSICGVDVNKFCPSDSIRQEEREKLHLGKDDVVFTFMGRINRDKGTYELLAAFNQLCAEEDHARLLLIGNSEGITNETFSSYPNISLGENLVCYGFAEKPYEALQAGDVFCLPSYREGFGMSAIEAASAGLPVICSDAYGLGDSYVDGVTGLKCKVKDVETLYLAMKKLYENPEMRASFGKAGRERILEKFTKEMVSSAWLNYFVNNL